MHFNWCCGGEESFWVVNEKKAYVIFFGIISKIAYYTEIQGKIDK